MNNQDTALKATQQLMDIVRSASQEARHAREEEANQSFNYGQDFDTLPEVWELEALGEDLTYIPYYGEIS